MNDGSNNGNDVEQDQTPRGVVRVQGPDQRGLVAAVTGVIAEAGGNIVEACQHSDKPSGVFMQRVEVEDLANPEEVVKHLKTLWPQAEVSWHDTRFRPRVVVACGKELHGLGEMLLRADEGELDIDVVKVVSNHENGRTMAERHGVEYCYLPVTKGKRPEQERMFADAVSDAEPDLLVLARYMLILPAWMCGVWPTINIHHSFLPAFKGQEPYKQAYERGVKLIGATGHYVKPELDEGPIIAQDVVKINYLDGPDSFQRRGRSLERNVLCEAVRLHVENRVFVVGNRTVVLE